MFEPTSGSYSQRLARCCHIYAWSNHPPTSHDGKIGVTLSLYETRPLQVMCKIR
jgi:hypothetical protein